MAAPASARLVSGVLVGLLIFGAVSSFAGAVFGLGALELILVLSLLASHHHSPPRGGLAPGEARDSPPADHHRTPRQKLADMSEVQMTENGKLRTWVAGHQILSFFLLSYAISWALWGIAALGGGQVVFLLGGLGPLISALLITRLSGRSVREWLRSLLVWRVSPGYYAIALLFPAAIYVVINLVLFALGHELDFSLLLGIAPGYLGTFLRVATVGGGFEEPGWRGFALPRLQARRSPLVSTLFLGLAWGIWHIPLYGPAGFIVPLILAFFYTWLYNRTGSVLICLLLHASFTPAQNMLTLVAAPAAGGGLADSIDLVILGVYIAAVICLTLATRGRLGFTSAKTDADTLRAR